MNHTPGPWNLVAGRTFITSSGEFYLAYGVDHGTGLPKFTNFCELDANARLIATAPELLLALEEVIKELEIYRRITKTACAGPSEAITFAQEVISKAKGESNE